MVPLEFLMTAVTLIRHHLVTPTVHVVETAFAQQYVWLEQGPPVPVSSVVQLVVSFDRWSRTLTS